MNKQASVNSNDNNDKNKNFEELLAELELVVKKMEGGKCGIEENIILFEKGIDLYKICKSKFSSIEKRIKILTKDLEEYDFEENVD